MIGATRYTAAAEISRQQQLSTALAKLEQQVSSGKRLTAASDDPTAAARIADIGVGQANNVVYNKNVNTGSAIASAVDTQLTSVQNALTRAKELVLNARTDSSSSADRASIATELSGIINEIASYSTSTDPNGNPLFPTGTATAIPVSDSLSLSATTSRDAVFSGVTTAGGSKSITDILSAAVTALQTGDTTGMTSSLDAIDAAAAHVTTVQTDQGLRQARFTDMKNTLADSDTNYAAERQDLEGTDLTYALSEIQSKQLSLQAAQTVFAQSHKTNLFSLLG